MEMNEYQEMAYKFAKYGGNPVCPFAGLAEEAGEVLGKYAKFVRKHDGVTPHQARDSQETKEDFRVFVNDAAKELGDCLWMISAIATELGVELDDIAEWNIRKLTDRSARGVIIGEGDNR